MQGLYACLALPLAGWHDTRRGNMVCRERLSLHGTAQPIDWEHPPDIPAIWSRQCDGVSPLLQDNVDAVIAQVSFVGVTCFWQQPECHGLKWHKQPSMHVLHRCCYS